MSKIIIVSITVFTRNNELFTGRSPYIHEEEMKPYSTLLVNYIKTVLLFSYKLSTNYILFSLVDINLKTVIIVYTDNHKYKW